MTFIDDRRWLHGVEPSCHVLSSASSIYDTPVAQRQDPASLLAQAQEKTRAKPAIARMNAENVAVYGVHKVWWK